MGKQANQAGPGGAAKKVRKAQAKTYARLRIQKRQKARAGSSGMIDTVKARKTIDAMRYEREHKAAGSVCDKQLRGGIAETLSDGSKVIRLHGDGMASGGMDDISRTQQAAQLSSYMAGHRLANGQSISESERIAWENQGISEKAMSEGHNNALRERTTLNVQLVASRTGQTYKQVWRRRKSLAVALIIKGKIERPRGCPDTLCSDTLKEWAGDLDTSGQVSLYCSVFDCLANP